MPHAEYTGKSGPSVVLVVAASIPTGWRQITVTERGKPAAEKLDITHAGDTVYSYMTDPLGSKGSLSCQVQVSGFLSVTDFTDTGITSKAIDSAATVTVKKSTAGDWFTMAAAIFRSFNTEAPFAGVVPYTATFALDGANGAWAAGA